MSYGQNMPNQLFTAGVQLRYANLTASGQVPNSYGIDEQGLVVQESEDEGITVPPIEFTLTDAQLSELQRRVDPLTDSNDLGIDLHVQSVFILSMH